MISIFVNIKKSIFFAIIGTIVFCLAFYIAANFKTRLKNDEQFNIYVFNDICLNQQELTNKINDRVITEKVLVDYGTDIEKVAVSAFTNSQVVILTKPYLESLEGDGFFVDLSDLNKDRLDPYSYNGNIIGIKIYDADDSSQNNFIIDDYFNFSEDMYLIVLSKNHYEKLDSHVEALLGDKNEYETN